MWTPETGGTAPAATDSLLLVQPTLAIRQLDAEAAAKTPDPAEQPGASEAGPNEYFEPDPDVPGVMHRKFKTRFLGTKQLNPDGMARDFKNIDDEILANLRAEGVTLQVRLDITATKRTGFEESTIRTLSENARTLKVEQSGLEESRP